MDSRELKEEIWDTLLSTKSAHKINNKQLAMRCPLCGDSKKDSSKTRFYVLINKEDPRVPIMYNCFNCNEYGFLTPSILRQIGISDLSINSSLVSYNKGAAKGQHRLLGMKGNSFKFKIPEPPDNDLNRAKCEYINKRLGINLSISEWIKFKVVFSLYGFLKSNSIEELTVKLDRARILEANYVGFLTAKNEFVNMRCVSNNPKLPRYDKYSIFKSLDNTRKFYVIPMQLDIMSTDAIYINIAEGVFDILGVYFNVNNRELKNNVYVAVCGSDYLSVIEYFIKIGVFGKNVVVNIYSDSDKPPYYYGKTQRGISAFVGKVNVYYNTMEKDFGVPKNKINIIKKRIPGK